MKTKLQALHQYLCKQLTGNVHAKKIHATQAGGELIVNGEDRGNGGYRIANWFYQAGILIENFPHNKLDPNTLFALVACWISEFDPERDENDELGNPDIEIDVNNEESADVLIKIAFEESIELIPDPKGLVLWNSQTYRVNPVEIWIAEEGEITNAANDNA